jgi:putative membrane protein
MIDAVATIVPGLSGTSILMMMGYYTFVITNIGNASLANINILLPFGLGFVITIILLVKVMHYLLENHNNKTYLAIIGFTLSSIVVVLYKALSISFTIPTLLLSVIVLIIGIFIGLRFEE